jgi:hypothetical protein
MGQLKIGTKWLNKSRTMLAVFAEHFTLHLQRRDAQMLVDAFTLADCDPLYEKPPLAPWEEEQHILVSCGGAGDGKWGTIEISPVFFDLSPDEVSHWAEVLTDRLREPVDHAAMAREDHEFRELVQAHS